MFLYFAGLLLWNLSAWRPRFSLLGIARLFAGAIPVLAALILLYVSFPGMSEPQFSFFATATFITALAAEFTVGEDIRQLLRSDRR